MDALIAGIAIVAPALSALAAYGASPHCRWPRLRRSRLANGLSAAALAAIALAACAAWLGIGAGTCAMLGSWMLTAMLLPCLAAWTGAEDRD